jgi:hypothetical protein
VETNGQEKQRKTKERWIEDIEGDVQIMGIRGWRKLCKKITEKAKTHSGL